MALLFFDGFDATNVAQKYAEITGTVERSTGYGRRGSNGVRIRYSASALRVHFTPAATIIVGFAVLFENSWFRWALRDPGGTIHVYVEGQGGGTLYVKRGDTTLLGSGTFQYYTNIWYYAEIKVYCHDTNGSFELRINEQTIASGSGLDTKNSATGTIGQFRIYNYDTTHMQQWYDDVYVCDDSGSFNNDFLGDCRVDTIVPSGAGYSTQWTPSTGTNYQCVDETPENTSDYVSTTVLNNIDSYAMGNLPAAVTGVICGLLLSTYAGRADTGVPTKIKPLIRTSSINYFGSEIELLSTWVMYFNFWEKNPNTSAAWAKADIDGIETGVQLTVVT